MARIKTRVDSLDRDIRVMIDDLTSPKERSQRIAAFARQALADGQAQNRSILGRTPQHETWVDGRPTEKLESVKPDGRIVFEFELVFEVFDWISRMLEEASPVGDEADPRPGHPGLYRRSHILMADGVEVPPNQVPPAAEEYAFVNLQPYARKIERGLSSQAPSGVYQTVAAVAKSKFGNVARVRFSYRSLTGGAIQSWASTTRLQSKRGHRGRTRSDWLTRQPAIVVTLR